MALKPVMFWLHGGVYKFAGTSRGDVVVITINYRLRTLGFLALDNCDFGGNPERIPIFGQSAGAASVRVTIASPKAAGKFSGAIAMSNLGGFLYLKTCSKYYTID
ncbi:carboxylesterase from carbohydrate esterase family gh10 [Colletotrichum incanum]|uniref:Carboxylic ester hydrolase n=1 Tax=Colletotrichum incanum TaxID=1573173 RepID=A0A161W016_COLIC|nr:carboxylesterase from carbohydrate esterase family gh10 [Colletotrichum incanum]OHW98676.1 carboxylesterase from carbohydrate esterase family gh10 [Colletotrichum incanum]